MSKGKLIGFWVLTGLLCLSQFLSGIMDVVQPPALIEVFTKLGYPTWVLYIIGPWKILGAIAIAAPGLKRAKEWAYAGFFFDFTGAAASHALNGDSLGEVMPPVVLCLILVGGYLLRPDSRKLAGPAI